MQALRYRVYELDWIWIYGAVRLRGWLMPYRDRNSDSLPAVYEALEQHRGGVRGADYWESALGLDSQIDN